MGSTYGPACGTKVAVHRGHMIASQYGISNPRKKMATFVYTNVVPQFGDFNSGPWQIYEQRLIVWGKTNCAMNGEARNVQLFIVVGAIPSTVFGPQQMRYFGRGGFSNYQDKDFRVNVPEVMWTAASAPLSLGFEETLGKLPPKVRPSGEKMSQESPHVL